MVKTLDEPPPGIQPTRINPNAVYSILLFADDDDDGRKINVNMYAIIVISLYNAMAKYNA